MVGTKFAHGIKKRYTENKKAELPPYPWRTVLMQLERGAAPGSESALAPSISSSKT
jgi:hypothetical protein